MKLDGRRESSNVEDRRGMGGGMKFGLGGGVVAIVVFLVAQFTGIDLSQFVDTSGAQQQGGTEYVASAEEEHLAQFSKKIEASTEDIWANIFKQNGMGQYQVPTLVLYSGRTSTACGEGSAACGPFYCSGDEKLYIDLSFFSQMPKQLGAGGELSFAYVIAHEVGHHVQYLTGRLNDAHQKMAQYGRESKAANEISVRLELQADFYAGVWAHHENKQFRSIEDGELEEAINCAMKIGDDYLQRQAGYGVVMPEKFTHGTSAQRMRWFKKGYETGDFRLGEQTFALPYSQL
ncbi:MAG: neutral zinc metallopeptidase [Bacteroidales bacterium]|nr:neutral zinc metallopeptidase [Bacteroidales bacterium]